MLLIGMFTGTAKILGKLVDQKGRKAVLFSVLMPFELYVRNHQVKHQLDEAVGSWQDTALTPTTVPSLKIKPGVTLERNLMRPEIRE